MSEEKKITVWNIRHALVEHLRSQSMNDAENARVLAAIVARDPSMANFLLSMSDDAVRSALKAQISREMLIGHPDVQGVEARVRNACENVPHVIRHALRTYLEYIARNTLDMWREEVRGYLKQLDAIEEEEEEASRGRATRQAYIDRLREHDWLEIGGSKIQHGRNAIMHLRSPDGHVDVFLWSDGGIRIEPSQCDDGIPEEALHAYAQALGLD